MEKQTLLHAEAFKTMHLSRVISVLESLPQLQVKKPEVQKQLKELKTKKTGREKQETASVIPLMAPYKTIVMQPPYSNCYLSFGRNDRNMWIERNGYVQTDGDHYQQTSGGSAEDGTFDVSLAYGTNGPITNQNYNPVDPTSPTYDFYRPHIEILPAPLSFIALAQSESGYFYGDIFLPAFPVVVKAYAEIEIPFVAGSGNVIINEGKIGWDKIKEAGHLAGEGLPKLILAYADIGLELSAENDSKTFSSFSPANIMNMMVDRHEQPAGTIAKSAIVSNEIVIDQECRSLSFRIQPILSIAFNYQNMPMILIDYRGPYSLLNVYRFSNENYKKPTGGISIKKITFEIYPINSADIQKDTI